MVYFVTKFALFLFVMLNKGLYFHFEVLFNLFVVLLEFLNVSIFTFKHVFAFFNPFSY